MVSCPYCTAMVTRSDLVVEAKTFHEAWLRARPFSNADPILNLGNIGSTIRVGDLVFLLQARLGRGNSSEVFLALRLDTHWERVVIHRALSSDTDGPLAREYAVLTALLSFDGNGSAYFSQRIPEAIALGHCANTGRETLVTRPISGCWGSLLDVMRHRSRVIDPRHGVWIWRRILDTLGYLHANGWAHGDVHPGHVLVQPADHGAFLIDWKNARPNAGSHAMRDDLIHSAWCIRALLHGLGDSEPGFDSLTPPALMQILRQVSEDTDRDFEMSAPGIGKVLKAAALADFGPPKFIHFDPYS